MGKLRQDRLELLYVDPMLVRYTISPDDPTLTGNSTWHFGSVSKGNWDLGGNPVQEHGDVFAILSKLVNLNMEHEDIPEFEAHMRQIEDGTIVDSCSKPEEYVARWEGIQDLYRSIKANGYKSQVELATENPLDEIRIQIGRTGELLFEEGLHRLAIAQLLRLDRVPTIVTRRHAEWARLRHDILKIVLQRGFVHQPFDHPDLDVIPLRHGGELRESSLYGHDRWEFIVRTLPISGGSVLDIGSYFGYFAHRFEDLGFECFAVEPDRENLAVLKRYRDMKDKAFVVWDTSIFDITRFSFDIILALNIFHHLVKEHRDFERLVSFLGQLNCQAMYFEPARNSEPGAYRSYDDKEFIDFVLGHTHLGNARFVGRAREGRNLYLLT
jgi:2-polyprenyl-3-methyl-5-hydroxy-6-metoxy-1,4-benzoquinol methylase